MVLRLRAGDGVRPPRRDPLPARSNEPGFDEGLGMGAAPGVFDMIVDTEGGFGA